MKIGCVVMASGISARFGGDKLLAPLWGKPLLAHLLDNLPETLARVVVVTRWEAVASLAYERGLEVLLHDFPQVSDTIRLGLSSLGDVEGCMFCTGDQPGLTKTSLQGLLDAFAARPERIVRLGYGEAAGSPVLFPRSPAAGPHPRAGRERGDPAAQGAVGLRAGILPPGAHGRGHQRAACLLGKKGARIRRGRFILYLDGSLPGSRHLRRGT